MRKITKEENHYLFNTDVNKMSEEEYSEWKQQAMYIMRDIPLKDSLGYISNKDSMRTFKKIQKEDKIVSYIKYGLYGCMIILIVGMIIILWV